MEEIKVGEKWSRNEVFPEHLKIIIESASSFNMSKIHYNFNWIIMMGPMSASQIRYQVPQIFWGDRTTDRIGSADWQVWT